MVLIVDDKPENIFSLQQTLERSGFAVDSAGSGEEALKKVLRHEYSLIILDVQMPGMDGFEVADALSGYSKAADIPIIFLSAVNTDKRFITRGFTAGGVDYVTKPVDPDVFLLKVKTLHRLCRQNRELERARQELLREVSVRKAAEDELSRRVAELRSILEAMPQLAFTFRPDGKLEFANEHWYVYSDDLTRMPLFHTDDSYVLKSLREALLQGKPFMAEVRIKNLLTGAFRWHLLRVIAVRGEQDKIIKWVGTFTDIQEQKAVHDVLEARVQERTQELEQKARELEVRNHELQQFASVASHDLKEPLRKIQVFGSIVKARHLQASPDAQDSMSRIIDSSERMSRLITDLLDYSRLSAGELFQPTGLKALVDDVVGELEFAISEKGAQVFVGPLPLIDAIPGQMRQVFQNLISNALKFTRTGMPPVIHIDGAEEGGTCRITVSDNGIGFGQEYAEKIFTIFQRLNTREAYEGTGIGLAIVRKIIEKHGGSILAKGGEGAGATFTIMLPIRQQLPAKDAITYDTSSKQ